MLLVGEFRRLFTCSHKFERVLELNMSYIRKGWTRLIGTLSFIFALVWLINLFDGAFKNVKDKWQAFLKKLST